jgi:hypothetical protein
MVLLAVMIRVYQIKSLFGTFASLITGSRPCLVAQFGVAVLLYTTVAHCSILFLFGNNCLNVD